MGVIIEVGVNTGSDTEKLLEKYPESKYYGFEPTIELHAHLLKKFRDNPNMDRMHFYPVAITENNGFAKFNVAGQGDWGCSSIHEFNPKIHEVWPNRTDFAVSHTYNVPTMRLDTFIQNYLLEGLVGDFYIDYLWIDAQGSDLDVLYSLGEYTKYVKGGKLETAYTVELYSNTNNTMENAISFLKKNNFTYSIMPDDVGKECNIEFWRD